MHASAPPILEPRDFARPIEDIPKRRVRLHSSLFLTAVCQCRRRGQLTTYLRYPRDSHAYRDDNATADAAYDMRARQHMKAAARSRLQAAPPFADTGDSHYCRREHNIFHTRNLCLCIWRWAPARRQDRSRRFFFAPASYGRRLLHLKCRHHLLAKPQLPSRLRDVRCRCRCRYDCHAKARYVKHFYHAMSNKCQLIHGIVRAPPHTAFLARRFLAACRHQSTAVFCCRYSAWPYR